MMSLHIRRPEAAMINLPVPPTIAEAKAEMKARRAKAARAALAKQPPRRGMPKPDEIAAAVSATGKFMSRVLG